MNLPNYFLADLPPEARVTATMIGDACQTLKRNREQYLAQRKTQNLVEVLCHVAQEWLDPHYPLRRLALEIGPATLGFSRPTLQSGLETFFKQWTPAGFEAWLEQDLGQARRLEDFTATPAERATHRAAMAVAPRLIAHIAAGNLPCSALQSFAVGLLTRSAQFLKCASGSAIVPRLFAHSIYGAEPKLGACLELAEWKGGDLGLEQALFEQADCVTATGSDDAIEQIRRRLPVQTRFLAYGHRASFAYIAAEAFSGGQLRNLLERAGTDITAWNQLGCLSPHVVYVQEGGMISAERFAELLAEELVRREATEPRGELPAETAATIVSRRSLYEIRAAHSPDTRHWCSPGTTAWTVVYEADPKFQLSCLNRFIYVKGVPDLATTLENADSIQGKTSTVGIAAPAHELPELAAQLARWGATRICSLGRMQNPPLAWRHDGRPALGDLLTWIDWEQE